MKRCVSCRCVCYCNRKCQLKMWKVHKKECFGLEKKQILNNVGISSHPRKGRILVSKKSFSAGEDVFAEYPIMIYKGSQFAEESALDEDVLFQEDSLKCYSKISEEKKKIIQEELYLGPENSLMSIMIDRIISRKMHLFRKFKISRIEGKKLLLALKFNSLCTFDKYPELSSFIGIDGKLSMKEKKGNPLTVLHLYVSKMSHSCAPNCNSFTLKNGLCHVVAMRNITEGEELTITYMRSERLLYPTVVRQKSLEKSFSFTCECERCLDPTGEITRQLTCTSCNKTAVLLSDSDMFEPLKCQHCSRAFPTSIRTAEINRLVPALVQIDQNPQMHLNKLHMQCSPFITPKKLLELFEKEVFGVFEEHCGIASKNFSNYWGSAILFSILGDIYRCSCPNLLDKRIELCRKYIKIFQSYRKKGKKEFEILYNSYPSFLLKLGSLYERKRMKKKALEFYKEGLKYLRLYYGKNFTAVGQVEKIVSRLIQGIRKNE